MQLARYIIKVYSGDKLRINIERKHSTYSSPRNQEDTVQSEMDFLFQCNHKLYGPNVNSLNS